MKKNGQKSVTEHRWKRMTRLFCTSLEKLKQVMWSIFESWIEKEKSDRLE